MNFDMTSYKTWAALGCAGGAGFGLFVAPLLFILVNLYFDGVTLFETIKFALANGFTWGVFGLITGVFAWFIKWALNPPVED